MEEEEVDDIVEHAISEKRTVKEVLVEMKDTSELMIDLAYSALFTNSKVIAEEVEKLEVKMDGLRYEIESLLMLSARTPEDAADLSGILHVAHSAEKISNAADDIVDVVLRGVGDHPIYKSFLDEVEEQVDKIEVEKGSEFDGKTIGEVAISKKLGSYIRAIRRGKSWICNPRKNTKLSKGDVLIVNGSESSLGRIAEMCKGM
ncbi:MAG: hypothetical protein L6243_04040 [Candidatus Altiarchaeales archaeon]|nr:potassium channel protein [Candidatus Altiarchaeota archaeon]MBU4342104.1 potassium channel protein [Candidatus Altiarchaeota archaeon]MBU4406638.1 potassium channel protein [Candidatus Altiarchaeota archaeon]MBU4437202.1 potassium channel protein [Candidatus Altiarchaeota archaeon]MCG2782741.1 hypothetical protein [Candidatus Altiarchaeales archaeon]